MFKLWTRQVLSNFVRTKLEGCRFIVVSNREPFQHRHVAGGVQCIQPASGMAAALDPVMRACGGLWIAHGSGDADKQMVDQLDHVRVPPDRPAYTLRRVWLSKEEEQGYYCGLSNQGLWPLCHVAFTRPIFDPDQWAMYRRVNQRFADAILEEAADDPTFVFIQDYHFALLPRMLRNGGSNLIIGQFWHIPWPNQEVFRSFPWQEEIVDGLLGNDLLGFHLHQYCQNFLEAVGTLEARVEEATMEVHRAAHSTAVRPFPIGIDFEEHADLAESNLVQRHMREWRRQFSLDGKLLGFGIDRLDYTKGIPERLRFLDRLLQQYPAYRGKLVFLQIAVPSRSGLPAYQQIEEEVDQLAAQINLRWGSVFWRPVVILKRHYSVPEMIALHRIAHFCVVASLHDGMNLVAKEFVASRLDGDGVLILSKFTGAARELKDAIHINPFSIEDGAEAFRAALQMHREERRRRMRKMRESVAQNNVYRWAGKFLSRLATIEFPGKAEQEYRQFVARGRRGAALGVAV